MKRVNPKVYTKEYYATSCLGFEGFKRFHLEMIAIKRDMCVLDLGCGKGDISIYLAQEGAKVVGVDYSKDAIDIAKNSLLKQSRAVRNKVSFFVKDAKKLDFPKSSFDVVISLDMFEHLYKEELEIVMQQIRSALKNNGLLFVHTEANKVYLDIVHPLYAYPISSFLVWINKIFTGKIYPNLPKDPRNALHKEQHVNEPTYFSLVSLFKRHNFYGRILPVIPLKPLLSWKDILYNIVVFFYPLCFLFPFHLFFAYDYVCIIKNKK